MILLTNPSLIGEADTTRWFSSTVVGNFLRDGTLKLYREGCAEWSNTRSP